jgi:hypothetical protein
MDPVVMGLLGSLGAVVGMLVFFVCIYRRHLRAMRRAGRGLDPLSPPTTARRAAVPFPMPPRWLAVKCSNTVAIRELLSLPGEAGPAWSYALARSWERRFFVSSPVDGWTLVIGASVPDPGQDVDEAFRFLTGFSAAIGEVQLFLCDRVSSFHGWARLKMGGVVRAYAWAGTTQWNQGAVTIEERLLGLRFRAYGEEAEPPAYGETSPEQQNADRVVLLARRWSVDPVAVSEILLQQEAEAADGPARDNV